MSQEDEIPEFKFEPSESILQKLKLIPTNEKITAAAGLGTLIEIFDQSGLKKEFIKCLPERKSPRSQGSYRMALNMIAGFIYGFDSLDDFDDFDKEEGIKALFGEGSPKGRTLGDFLRDFDGEHLIRLNQFLSKQSYSMMRSLQNNLAEEFQPNRCSAFLLDAEVVRKRRQEVGVPDRDKKNTGQGKIRRASS